MNKVLLLLDHKENRRLLAEWLKIHYQVLLPKSDLGLNDRFDLCIVDGSALSRLGKQVQARKKTEQPVFLPFLFVSSSLDVGMVTQDLWQSVDELITSPIQKVELQARVEILLRSRRLSLELSNANKQLQREMDERQRAEADLRQSEAEFRKFIEAAPDAIVIIDKQGHIVLVNSQTEKMFGYNRNELIGFPIDRLLPTPLPQVEDENRAKSNSEPEVRLMGVGSDLYARRKDGSEFPVDVSLSPIETKNGQLVTTIIRDITERKRIEVEIQNALQKEKELNEFKSHFVSMVSHEFRNPLTAILVSTELLERYKQQATEERKSTYVHRIESAAKQMTHLLEDVLVIGKAETGKLEFNPESLDVEEFCRDLVEELQLSTSSQHAIAFLCQAQFPKACMDKNLLRHILTNLLSNAIKYSPQGCTVNFELTYQNGEAIFQIQDQGIGISLEDQQQLFESFYRGKNVGKIPGTGLGLTIVKNAVDLHGGQITVTSEVGVGTTFRVRVPLNNSSQLKAEG